MNLKSFLKYTVLCIAIIIFACSPEFDNPYDSEINKPELVVEYNNEIIAKENTINLGIFEPKKSVNKKINIKNIGKGILKIKKITYSGGTEILGNFTSFDNIEISPNAEKELSITFYTELVDTFDGKINISFGLNDDTTDYQISVVASTTSKTYEGNYLINSQEQVNAFNYTSINGSLIIEEGTENNILNLNGLDILTSVTGAIEIKNNPNLKTVEGLKNITEVSTDLIINNNPSLYSIVGLSSITQIGHRLTIEDNDNLVSLEGLNKLVTLGADLNSGTKSSNTLIIKNNAKLNDFCALNLLFEEDGFVGSGIISDNLLDTNIENLKNKLCNEENTPNTIFEGNLVLDTQQKVNDFNYTKIIGDLIITGDEITQIDALSSLITIEGSFELKNTTQLESIDGLVNIEEITINLTIEDNDLLSNMSALNKLDIVGGDFTIKNNPSLNDFCVFSILFNNNNVSGNYTVTNNGYNPTQTDIKNNNDCKQIPVHNGNLTLNTQALVTQYSYLTEVNGDLIISGTNINDLSSLNKLTKISGKIDITNTALTNLSGLENLEEIGTILQLYNNANLENIESLTKITSVDYLYVYNNDKLTNLSGLNNLKTITSSNGLIIQFNDALTDLSALGGITSINNRFTINNNPLLKDFCVFTNLFNAQTFGSYNVSSNGYNPTQTQIRSSSTCKQSTIYSGSLTLNTQALINQYSYLTEVTGNLTISGTAVNDISALSNLNKVGAYIDIHNTLLSNLDGLENLNQIGTHLYIRNNGSLTSIDALSKITTVQYLYIYNNDRLTNLSGLNNLKTITSSSGLVIQFNDALIDLSALGGITSINNRFTINNNPLLKDFCVFTNLFNAQTFRSYSMSSNGYNPTQTQIRSSSNCKENTSSGSTTSTVTDINGNTYKTVTIGTQTWMAENLRVTRSFNGGAITAITNDTSWGALADNDTAKGYYNTNGTTYYSYAAAKEVCPTGWSLPDANAIITLNAYIKANGNSNVSTALKATSWSGTDNYEFNATPSGLRLNSNGTLLNNTTFYYLWGKNTSNSSSLNADYYNISSTSTDVRYYAGGAPKSYGFCVRCIKN